MRFLSGFFLITLFYSIQAGAFEKKNISFENESNNKKRVEFVFLGEIFSPPLNLFSKKEVKKNEIRQFFDFFKKLYDVNKNGTKKDILLLWSPLERLQLEKEIDIKAFEQNKERFNAISAMQLKMIIEYGDYYICYVNTEFVTGDNVVMKYPVMKIKGNLFLSNKLNGDYFYDVISHYLDKENFSSILNKTIK